MSKLDAIARRLAELTLDEIEYAHSGHLSSSLSSVNIITSLYFSEMRHNPHNPYEEDRDRFVLSKGHAAPALYAALSVAGYFDEEELHTLRRTGARLQGHPSRRHSREIGIEASTGSLGEGLSIACGLALDAKMEHAKYRVYSLMGDGECDEGLVWEAALFAAQNKLGNLTVLLDRNGTQMDGRTREVLALEPLSEKWRAFGWNVVECDNEIPQIIDAIKMSKKSNLPTMIVVHTHSSYAPVPPKPHSPIESLGDALVNIGEKRDDIVVMTADLKYSTGLYEFSIRYPERFIECGIAEANMVGAAYGIASSGKMPFVVTHSIWLSGRAWEGVRMICADGLNVKFVGTHAGLTNGQDGFSHHSTEDIAVLRALDGLRIIAPSTCAMTYEAIVASSKAKGPVYIRVPRISFEGELAKNIGNGAQCTKKRKFIIGKAIKHYDGDALSIFAAGPTATFAISAWFELHEKGISCDIVELPTIKPLDEKAILSSVKKTGRAIVVEDHSVYGGLGGAVCELLAEKEPVRVHRLGTTRFTETGPARELYEKFGLGTRSIVEAAKKIIKSEK